MRFVCDISSNQNYFFEHWNYSLISCIFFHSFHSFPFFSFLSSCLLSLIPFSLSAGLDALMRMPVRTVAEVRLNGRIWKHHRGIQRCRCTNIPFVSSSQVWFIILWRANASNSTDLQPEAPSTLDKVARLWHRVTTMTTDITLSEKHHYDSWT